MLTELFSLAVTAEELRANIDRTSAKFSCSLGRPALNIFAQIDSQCMPYNFVADSIHTKKLCSRLSSEVQF